MTIRDELTNCIIDRERRNLDWYYYGFYLSKGSESEFIECYNNGIKSPRLRNEKESGHNGLYYVSLAKILDCKGYLSSYSMIVSSRLAFIIDGIRPVKMFHHDFQIFRNTILPLRYSVYEDEFQEFLKVSPKKYIGLQFSMQEIEFCVEKHYKDIKVLADILDYLITIDSLLPFYGFDDPKGDLYLLDKAKCRNLINSSFKD